MQIPKDYDVYFELYGKKMKATVMALTKDEAKQKVFSKIMFHKIEESKDEWNKAAADFKTIFDILG